VLKQKRKGVQIRTAMSRDQVTGTTFLLLRPSPMIANPIATVKGLASLVRHPIKSAKIIFTEGVKACRKDLAACIGKLAFEVA
jgi:hypothetical protein